LAGDVIQAGGPAVASEHLFGDLQNALTVALGISAGLASGSRLRGLLLGHGQFWKIYVETENVSGYHSYPERVSVLSGGGTNVNSGAILTGRVLR
jgi:hypothetical protein